MEQVSVISLEEIKLSTDRSTFSNFNKVKTTNIVFDWNINFDESKIEGNVHIQMKSLEDIETVTLDTWKLNLGKILFSYEDDEEMQDCQSKLGEETEIGSRLDITLPVKVDQGRDFNINITYSTSPDSKALSWLKPEQTLDKECPFLFSQSEPIYSRAIFPCQDTPSIKFPYVAHVSVKSPMTVLLSADIINQYTEGENNIFDFEMKMPIPSYLVAVLVGKLDFRKIGERCGVYAEPSFVDKCAAEFEDMEKFL